MAAQELCVRWEVLDASEGPQRQVYNGYWNVFGVALYGHRVYVLPERGPRELLELDMNARAWRRIVSDQAPKFMLGSSLTACDEKLVCLDQDLESKTVKVFDLILLEWSIVQVYSIDRVVISRYHTTDFFESERTVLINTPDTLRRDEGNSTFTLNVDTMELRKLNTKGPLPSQRWYHTSILLEQTRKWIITCGQGKTLLDDICILDLHATVPAWTIFHPFSEVGGMSLCSPVLFGSKLLLFGGVRTGMSNQICSFDLHTGEVVENIRATGNAPQTRQYLFQRVVQLNDTNFLFIASQRLRGMERTFKGVIDTVKV